MHEITTINNQTLENVVLYNDGELELNVSINNETVWLNRNQLSQLLGRYIKIIGKTNGAYL